jgi:hypothetical protein
MRGRPERDRSKSEGGWYQGGGWVSRGNGADTRILTCMWQCTCVYGKKGKRAEQERDGRTEGPEERTNHFYGL